MKIRFATNTVALVGGVQQHFAAGEHDIEPDSEAQALVDAGDASLVGGGEGGGDSQHPTDAQLAAAEAAEVQRVADEAKAKADAEAEAAEAEAAEAEAEAQRVADEAQASAAADAAAQAEAEAKAQPPAPAANTKKAGGKK